MNVWAVLLFLFVVPLTLCKHLEKRHGEEPKKHVDCDDGKTGIEIDLHGESDWKCYENSKWPENIKDDIDSRCYKKERAYHVCIDRPIENLYKSEIPHSGPHRAVWAKYGEYNYIPPGRYVHNLEHGAVMFMYHPCAPTEMVNLLRKTATTCLYRYILTAFPKLTKEYPFAVITYGCIFRMSRVEPNRIKEWVRGQFGKSPEADVYGNGHYIHGLLVPSVEQSLDDYDDAENEFCPDMVEEYTTQSINFDMNEENIFDDFRSKPVETEKNVATDKENIFDEFRSKPTETQDDGITDKENIYDEFRSKPTEMQGNDATNRENIYDEFRSKPTETQDNDATNRENNYWRFKSQPTQIQDTIATNRENIYDEFRNKPTEMQDNVATNRENINEQTQSDSREMDYNVIVGASKEPNFISLNKIHTTAFKTTSEPITQMRVKQTEPQTHSAIKDNNKEVFITKSETSSFFWVVISVVCFIFGLMLGVCVTKCGTGNAGNNVKKLRVWNDRHSADSFSIAAVVRKIPETFNRGQNESYHRLEANGNSTDEENVA